MKICICGGKLQQQNEVGNIRVFQCAECHRQINDKIQRKEKHTPQSYEEEDLAEMGYRPRRH